MVAFIFISLVSKGTGQASRWQRQEIVSAPKSRVASMAITIL